MDQERRTPQFQTEYPQPAVSVEQQVEFRQKAPQPIKDFFMAFELVGCATAGYWADSGYWLWVRLPNQDPPPSSENRLITPPSEVIEQAYFLFVLDAQGEIIRWAASGKSGQNEV